MKIKIVITPLINYPTQFREIQHSKQLLPSYGAGCIVSFLRKSGYTVTIEDLSIGIDGFKSFLRSLSNIKMLKALEDYLIRNVPNKRLDNFAEQMLQYTSKDQADIIGFSIFSRFNLPCALLLAKEIKEKTAATVIFGGALMTLYTEFRRLRRIDKFLQNFKFIDYVIFGEGTVPLLKLLAYLQGKIKINDVPNLVYRQADKVIINQRKLFAIEDMSIPEFDDALLDMYRQMHSQPDKKIYFRQKNRFPIHKPLWLPYQLTRGCTRRCSFCNYYLIDPRMEFKSHQKVIQELIQLKKKYKTSHFYFCDSELNISYRYLDELCDLIINNKLNIIWRSFISVNNMDRNLLKKMKMAGCYCLVWGVESGSDRILQLMDKGFSASEAATALKDAHHAGIRNFLCFITGFVQETDEDINQTIKFIQDNAAYIDHVRLLDFAFPPYTEIAKYPERFGIKNIFLNYQSLIGFGHIGWDETNGLEWKDKLKQKGQIYRKTQQAVDRIFAKKYSLATRRSMSFI